MSRAARVAALELRDLARARRWEAALAYLTELPQKRLEANIFHFGAALSAETCWRRALSLLCQAVAVQLEANVVIYSCCVSACDWSSIVNW